MKAQAVIHVFGSGGITEEEKRAGKIGTSKRVEGEAEVMEVFMVGMMNSKAGMTETQMDLRGEPRHEEKKLIHC